VTANAHKVSRTAKTITRVQDRKRPSGAQHRTNAHAPSAPPTTTRSSHWNASSIRPQLEKRRFHCRHRRWSAPSRTAVSSRDHDTKNGRADEARLTTCNATGNAEMMCATPPLELRRATSIRLINARQKTGAERDGSGLRKSGCRRKALSFALSAMGVRMLSQQECHPGGRPPGADQVTCDSKPGVIGRGPITPQINGWDCWVPKRDEFGLIQQCPNPIDCRAGGLSFVTRNALTGGAPYQEVIVHVLRLRRFRPYPCDGAQQARVRSATGCG